MSKDRVEKGTQQTPKQSQAHLNHGCGCPPPQYSAWLAGFAAIGGLQDSQGHPAALCSPSAASWGRLDGGGQPLWGLLGF